nr:hypothetical protein CFP56_24641 [Quercus suber]
MILHPECGSWFLHPLIVVQLFDSTYADQSLGPAHAVYQQVGLIEMAYNIARNPSCLIDRCKREIATSRSCRHVPNSRNSRQRVEDSVRDLGDAGWHGSVHDALDAPEKHTCSHVDKWRQRRTSLLCERLHHTLPVGVVAAMSAHVHGLQSLSLGRQINTQTSKTRPPAGPRDRASDGLMNQKILRGIAWR